MNIIELAKQANGEPAWPGGVDWTWDELKTFAKLVVKECSYLADQAHHKATGGKSAGGYIRQHFGVEE